MRGIKILTAVVAFLLFYSIANALPVAGDSECLSGPEESEGVGAEKVSEYCSSIKSRIEGAAGGMVAKIEGANAATGEIDSLLLEYESICDNIPLDEIDAKTAEIEGMLEEKLATVEVMDNLYATNIKQKIADIESKIDSSASKFDNLCDDKLVQTADEKIGMVDGKITDVEGWVNGLPDDALLIINENGGDDAAYQKFKEMHDNIQAARNALGSIGEAYDRLGGVCNEVVTDIGGDVEELKGSFNEMGGYCGEMKEFIQDEAMKPLEELSEDIKVSDYVEDELADMCDSMRDSVSSHIPENEGFLCDMLDELVPLQEEALEALNAFMDFRNMLQRYMGCYNCLEVQASKLGARQSTFQSQASSTCDSSYESAKGTYKEWLAETNRVVSYNYLSVIYGDDEFSVPGMPDSAAAEAFLALDSEIPERCSGNTLSQEAYGNANEKIQKVISEAGKAKLTLYSSLLSAFSNLLDSASGIIDKLGSVIGGFGNMQIFNYISNFVKFLSYVAKVLNVFLKGFNILSGACQEIADAEKEVDEILIPMREADKLDNWRNNVYDKLTLMGAGMVGKEEYAQSLAAIYYTIADSSKNLEDRSLGTLKDIVASDDLRPLYQSKPDYIQFIEEWNEQIEYDLTEIIKEMPVTASLGPVEIALTYGSSADEMLSNLPSPICEVSGLFRTEASKGNEGSTPLEMPYDESDVMWAEIFGITPDIEMRDPDCNILIYDFGTGEEVMYEDLVGLLESDNYRVDYRGRAGNDITEEFLLGYCQVWFIDSCDAQAISGDEVNSVKSYHEANGSLLLTGEMSCSSNVNGISSSLVGVDMSRDVSEPESESEQECPIPDSPAMECIYPQFVPHELVNGVTTISPSGISIQGSGEEVCTYSGRPCTMLSEDGRIVFDSSSRRFSDVLECENYRYVLNIARFLSAERWTRTGDIKVYLGGGCTRYQPGTNMEEYHLYCENPLTLIEDEWSPYPLCSWLMDKTMCWKGGNNRGEVGWYHGPIEDWVTVKVRYKDANGAEREESYVKKGKPHLDTEDTINSYFAVDAEIPEDAASDLAIEAAYSCKTTFERQVYHIKGEMQCGDDYNYIIPCFCIYSVCIYLQCKNTGCEQANTETIIDTSTLRDTWAEIDSWMSGDSLFRYGSQENLDVGMSGSVRPYSDGAWEIDLNLDANPDIISSFRLDVGEYSLIDHQERFYPVKHELYRRFSSSGSEKKEYNLMDNYGYEASEHNYPWQCKNTCPPLECECPDSILEPICWDPDSESGYEIRTDCACIPEEGQENLCRSDRTFHEDDGIYYDFVRISAYDLDELGIFGYTPQKTVAIGAINAEEITNENGVYRIHFNTERVRDPVTGETYVVTEEDIDNAELTVFTAVESAVTKSLSEWMEETAPPETTLTTTPTTTIQATTTIYDTCTPACSADSGYEECNPSYYAYCRASCNSGEETPAGGLGNDWCQSQTAKDLGVGDDGYVCCCCCEGGTC